MQPLFRSHEQPFQAQYSEIKERAVLEGELLPGTPGMLTERTGTGAGYWYRVYYAMPGKQVEKYVCTASDEAARLLMLERIEASEWMARQVSNLKKLGYQVADRAVASVLVELHNRHLFEAGLVVVGTLAYMSWLNEYGVRAVAARTQDIDLARRQQLKIAAPEPFLAMMKETKLPFSSVPGLPSRSPSTSAKLPGKAGLRVDVLAPGIEIGQTLPIPELQWHAQTIPYYDYLLEDSRKATVLAGGHCVPVLLPQPERMVWHKVYSSLHRESFPDKAKKDLLQAVTLAAVLAEQSSIMLKDSFHDAPEVLQKSVQLRMPQIQELLAAHPETGDAFRGLPR